MDPTTTTTSSGLVPAADGVFADGERLALVGFLAGYRGQTRAVCALTQKVSKVPKAEMEFGLEQTYLLAGELLRHPATTGSDSKRPSFANASRPLPDEQNETILKLSSPKPEHVPGTA